MLRRRGTIGYALGMAVYMFIVALYPAFKNDVSLNQFTEGKSTVAALYVAFRNLSPPASPTKVTCTATFSAASE